MSQALLIIGMHRSGTSALTKLVNLLGAELGSGLMEAATDNAKGFYEQKDIVQAHEHALAALGHYWYSPSPLPQDWLSHPSAIEAGKELLNICRTHFSNANLWALKDPRTSLILPLWHQLLADMQTTPHHFIAYRHPMEVAASLHKRDSLPVVSSLAIWLHYHLMAERHSRNHPRALVSYEHLLNDWRTEITTASTAAHINWPHAIPDAASEIDAFLSPALRHHSEPQPLPNHPISPLITRAITLTDSWHATQRTDQSTWDALAQDWQELMGFFSPLLELAANDAVRYSPKYTHAQHIVKLRDKELKNLQVELAEARQQHEKTQQKYSDLEIQSNKHAQHANALQRTLSWRITAPLRALRKCKPQ